MNSTYGVGENVNFTCIPVVNGSPGIATWSVTPVGQGVVVVLNTTDVPGTSGSYLLGDNRNTMVLVNVSEVLDGSTVVCTGLPQDLSTSRVAPAVFLSIREAMSPTSE